jgi:hypothetical protein
MPHFIPKHVLPLLLLASINTLVTELSADEPGTAPVETTPAADPALREAALENLLSERSSPKSFEQAVTTARQTGVTEQAILEARFLYHVDQEDDSAIAALLPEFLKRRDSFDPADSAIFALTDDWLAVVEYVRAIAALEKNDRTAFKKHITEAFWLSPGQAAAFAPQIERVRLEDAMREVRVDLTIAPAPLAGDSPARPLTNLLEDRKALLIHFWSPWSRECDDAMPDFITTATLLERNDIAVLSLLPDQPQKLRDDALAMIRPHAAKPCGTWALDANTQSLARLFRVRSLPSMVLVSTTGSVLFNGDPSDPRLWNTLQVLAPEIKRPSSSSKEQE